MAASFFGTLGYGQLGTLEIVNTSNTSTPIAISDISQCMTASGKVTWKIRGYDVSNPFYQPGWGEDRLRLEAGRARIVELPDGALLRVDEHGNYRIEDDQAHVIYQANRIREFNRFVNASDIMEEFVRFCGGLGLRRRQLLALPVELFLKFLVLKAAEADGEAPPLAAPLEVEVLKALPPRSYPRCLLCGRFVPCWKAEARVPWCSVAHMDRHAARQGLQAECQQARAA